MNTNIFTYARYIVIVSALMVGMNRTAHADVVNGVSLGAQNIVDAFNSMISGEGWWFYTLQTDTNTAGHPTLAKIGSGIYPTTPNLSGYKTVENIADYKGYPGPWPAITTVSLSSTDTYYVHETLSAKLNYNAITGTTGTINDARTRGGADFNLSVGAALLYKWLAQEELSDNPWGNTGNNTDYTNAMKILNGDLAWADTNKYLELLLAENENKEYWYADYDPDAFYTEIGNYCVFVMSSPCTEFLFIAEAQNPYENAVPEPGTMLILGLGLVGLPLARRLRKS